MPKRLTVAETKPKTPTQIATRVDGETYDAFNALAEKHGRTVAGENRQAIEHWLAVHSQNGTRVAS